jgi:hypothetical protein
VPPAFIQGAALPVKASKHGVKYATFHDEQARQIEAALGDEGALKFAVRLG